MWEEKISSDKVKGCFFNHGPARTGSDFVGVANHHEIENPNKGMGRRADNGKCRRAGTYGTISSWSPLRKSTGTLVMLGNTVSLPQIW